MKACALCGKSGMYGGTRKLLRGHYNPTNYGKKRANLQYTTDPKTKKRMLVCTACLRTLSKPARKRAPAKPKIKTTK